MSSNSDESSAGELPDEKVDQLLDQLAERADERDDLDFRPGSKRSLSRRSLLGAVGAAGVGALALGSSQNAQAQTGQWGNATGSAGTESKPFSEAWVQDLHSESISTDELSGGVAPSPITNLAGTGLEVDSSGNLIAPSSGSATGSLTVNKNFGNGAWTWFCGPTGVFDSQSDTTYMGWISSSGDVTAAAYDHSADSITTTVLRSNFEVDDHNNPGVLLRDDGHLMYFYSEHANEDQWYFRTSSATRDISSFDAEQTVTHSGTKTTYMNPRQRASDGRIYNFHRQDSGQGRGLYEMHSDDGGATWSAPTEVITPNGTRTYFQLSEMTNGRVDICASRTAAAPNEDNIYDALHCYWEGGSLYDVNGTDLGTLPITDTNLPVVYDSSATGNDRAWCWDVAYHGGDIEMVWAVINSYTDHDYHWARYDSSAGSWTTAKVADGGQYITNGNNGQRAYSGGIALDQEIPGRVYYAEIPSSTSAETYVAETDDGGTSWNPNLISAPDEIQARPMVPVDRNPEVPALWMRGSYDYFETFDTSAISGYGSGPALGSGSSDGGSSFSVITADGFEDADLSEYSGSTGSFTVDTAAPVHEGSYSLKPDTNFAEIISTSGLPEYPGNGDTYRVAAQSTQSASSSGDDNIQFAVLVQDANNLYLVQSDISDGGLSILEKAGGSYTSVVSTTGLGLSANTFYYYDVVLNTDDSVEVIAKQTDGTTIDSVTAAASDFTNTYSTGGIGWRGGQYTVYDAPTG